MQPDNLAAKVHRLPEQVGIGGERQAQTGLDEIVGESCDEGRMGEDGGAIGEDILRRHFATIGLCEKGQQFRANIGLGRGAVTPERKGSAAK